MPQSALRPCAYPGCPNLARTGLCPQHEKVRQAASSRRDQEIQRLYDRRWKKRRIAQLAEYPWCADCLSLGIYTPANEAHHILAHKGNVELFFRSPLLSLCKGCHSKRTVKELRRIRDNYYPMITEGIAIPLYLVCGPPGSGKSTFIDAMKKPDDIVIDLDLILVKLTGLPIYSPRTDETLSKAIRYRNNWLESLQKETDLSKRVWFIVSAGDPKDRTIWKALLRPAIVYVLPVPEETCIERIQKDPRRKLIRAQHKEAVRRWWEGQFLMDDEEIVEGVGG